jgi:methylglyoxal synthase
VTNLKPRDPVNVQPVVMPAVKTIALVAHDNRKGEMVDWASWNKPILAQHLLCATGTTGSLLESEVGLSVTRFRSGPLGGDQQIGAGITEGHIDFVVFFWDPLESHSHDVDVKALLRIAAVYNIPIACNRSSADFMVTSPLMSGEYVRLAFDYDQVVSPAEESAARL